MALTDIIGKVWVAEFNSRMKEKLASGNIVTTEYEGVINGRGDTVRIPYINNVEIKSYTGTIVTDDLGGGTIDLVIDQHDYFSVFVDSVTERLTSDQMDLVGSLMDKATRKAKNKIDKYVFASSTSANVDNVLAERVLANASDAYNLLVDLGVVLDESDMPEDERYVIVPSWVHGLIQKDNRFAEYREITNYGKVLNIGGLDVFKSNNLPTDVDGVQVVAGVYKNIAEVAIALDIEAIKHPDKFGTNVRGEFIYGAKLLEDKSIATCKVSKS